MNLYERVFRLTARLVNFLAELTRISSRHAVGGQREMSEVSQKLSELGSVVQQYVLILPPLPMLTKYIPQTIRNRKYILSGIRPLR